MNYKEFLKTKVDRFKSVGFKPKTLNKNLFPFQKHIVNIALEKGRYAIFADCGLGKTLMQLDFAYQVTKKTKKPVLILCPLAVVKQTISEGVKFGIDVQLLKSDVFGEGVFITNYEQLKNVDVSSFSGVVLDESSILKNFTGKYKNMIIDLFKSTPYKLACTATPSPNDINEIGNHSEFLGVLDAQDMRSRWFVREDGMNNYRLKKHAKGEFYAWVSSWASMISKPSDLGFKDEGYSLPSLNFIEKEVKILASKENNNGKLFQDKAVNATTFNKELKLTKVERFEEVAKIVNNSNEQFIIWVNQNEESKYCKSLIPDGVEVKGDDNPDLKESRLLGFAKNEFRVLITKKKIAQFGLNYQNCNNQVFATMDFSFEGLYQAIRRSYRFGQEKPVNIYMITTNTMENVIKIIKKKESQFLELQNEMNKNINEKKYGLVMDYKKKEYKNNKVHLIYGDSCEEIKSIPSNSVDFIIFSPPFSSLFTYSNSYRDMGNNSNHDEFFKQYNYLLPELYRILKPGRLMACHTKDLATYKNSSGYSGIYDFTGKHSHAVETAGFKLHSKINIWTDPVLEMQRTKTQRLLYKQVTKDSSASGVGLPEYLYVYRKWEGDSENWTPINNKTKDVFDLDTWQSWASPIWNTSHEDIKDLENLLQEFKQQAWFDIKRTDVLNNREGTAQGDEKHIAPLQLSVIEKAVKMWSNPNELVFTPFMGIGSEVYQAVKSGRRGMGIELKESYYDVAVKNIKNVLSKKSQLTLF